MKQLNLLLEDPSLLEKFSREAQAIDKNQNVLSYKGTDGFAHEVLEEEMMSKIEELTGNGEGRVTCSANLDSSVEYGNKAGAFFSVSVNCNGDLETVHKVHDILAPFIRKIVEQDCGEMRAIRDEMIGLKPKVSTPTVASAPTKAAKPTVRR